MTQTAPTDSAQPAERSLVRLDVPAPTANGPADGVALVTIDREEVLNAL